MFQNLKLGPRLIVGFLVPVVLLLVLGGVSLVALQTERNNMTSLYNDRVVPLKQLKVIADAYAVNVVDAVNKANAGLFTAEQARKEVQSAEQIIEKEWVAYMATTLTTEEAQLAKEAVALFEAAKRDLSRVVVALESKSGSVAGQLNDLDGALYTSIDPISSKISELIELQLRVAAEVNQSADVAHQQVLWIEAAVVVVAVVLSLWVAWSIAQSVVRPVSQAQRLAEGIAQGDLTLRVQAQGRDEVAELVRALSRMSDYLTRVVHTVRMSSDQVAQGAAEIAMGTADLSQRTESQAASLEETSASMTELTEAVRHNADTSREASQLASRARESATRGGESVSAVVSTMQDIEASSRRIADIIGVIDGIAFQTNILALNAAVEAARAGEQGRGFAVVAGEVRSLAQRSAEAAKEIKDLISDSVQRVAVGSEQVAEAGASVNDIVAQVQRVADLINEITHASGEQSQGIAEVSTAVLQMDQATQQNAALVEESTAAAESLRNQAQVLVQEVSTFRLN